MPAHAFLEKKKHEPCANNLQVQCNATTMVLWHLHEAVIPAEVRVGVPCVFLRSRSRNSNTRYSFWSLWMTSSSLHGMLRAAPCHRCVCPKDSQSVFIMMLSPACRDSSFCAGADLLISSVFMS